MYVYIWYRLCESMKYVLWIHWLTLNGNGSKYIKPLHLENWMRSNRFMKI